MRQNLQRHAGLIYLRFGNMKDYKRSLILQGIFEEVMALSESLPTALQKKEPVRPTLSPSRFLKVASHPTEEDSSADRPGMLPVRPHSKKGPCSDLVLTQSPGHAADVCANCWSLTPSSCLGCAGMGGSGELADGACRKPVQGTGAGREEQGFRLETTMPPTPIDIAWTGLRLQPSCEGVS